MYDKERFTQKMNKCSQTNAMLCEKAILGREFENFEKIIVLKMTRHIGEHQDCFG